MTKCNMASSRGEWLLFVCAVVMSGFIDVCLQVYVKINKDAETDETVRELAKLYFNRMEQGKKLKVQHLLWCCLCESDLPQEGSGTGSLIVMSIHILHPRNELMILQ